MRLKSWSETALWPWSTAKHSRIKTHTALLGTFICKDGTSRRGAGISCHKWSSTFPEIRWGFSQQQQFEAESVCLLRAVTAHDLPRPFIPSIYLLRHCFTDHTVINKYFNQKSADFGQLGYSKKLPYCVIKHSKTKAGLFSLTGEVALLDWRHRRSQKLQQLNVGLKSLPGLRDHPPQWTLRSAVSQAGQDRASLCSCCSKRIAEEKG